MKITKVSGLNKSVSNQKNQSKSKNQQNFTADMGRVSKEAQEIFGASEKDILEFLAQPEHIGRIKGIYSKKKPWTPIKIDIDELRFGYKTKGKQLMIKATTDGQNTMGGYTSLSIPQNFKLKETPSFVDTLVEKMQTATDKIIL